LSPVPNPIRNFVVVVCLSSCHRLAQHEAACVKRCVLYGVVQEVESKSATHVREKMGTENWLMIPPDMMMAEHAIFYHDFKNLFAKYTFYGIEFDLLVRTPHTPTPGPRAVQSTVDHAQPRSDWYPNPKPYPYPKHS
jgi:hypothetical protein